MIHIFPAPSAQMKAAPRSHRLRSALGLLSVLALISLTLTPHASAQAQSTASYIVIFGESERTGGNQSLPGTSATSSGTYTYPGLYADLSASVGGTSSISGEEDVPELHAYATATESPVAFGDTLGASATAAFTDSLFIHVPSDLLTLSGGLVNIRLLFELEGSAVGGGQGSAQVTWGNASSSIGPVTGGISFVTSASTGDLTNLGDGDFLGNFSLSLTAEALANQTNPTSEADYHDTLVLTEAVVTDDNGNPIPATFSDTNSDGTPGPILFLANTPLAATPEPSTWALLLGGLGAFAAFYRRRLLNV